ncbi:hypothetical protein Tco_0956985 [Tanacetum coccineum]
MECAGTRSLNPNIEVRWGCSISPEVDVTILYGRSGHQKFSRHDTSNKVNPPAPTPMFVVARGPGRSPRGVPLALAQVGFLWIPLDNSEKFVE